MNTVAVALALLAAPPDRVTVHPADTGAALCNPNMGWVFHFYDNVPTNYGSRLEPADTLPDFPGLTVVYLRIPWSYVEPAEGRFNWATVDGPAQRWIAAGKQVAFRFSCAESWTRWATPEWVQQAGVKGFNFTPGKGVTDDGPFWEPDYDDAIFLEKLDHFLAACAARYDGDPTVAFFDVGSFGVWGEGHTYASSGRPWSAETVKRHIALHQKHFHHTRLAANDDFSSQGRGDDVVKWAAEQGLTLRDDSILVQPPPNAYFHANFADWFWRDKPVILESEHYGGSRDRGCWGDGQWYLQAVEDYHASWCSIHWWPREFLTECRALIDRMNLRMGYRLQLAEASWPGRLRVGDGWHFASAWRNAGVAPCYPGGRVAVTLKDAEGGLASVFVVPGFDARSLPTAAPGQAPAQPVEADFALPFDFHAGTYDVFISVGDAVGTPKLELPLPEGDAGKRYRIGRMEVTADYAVAAGQPERTGDGWRLPLTFTTHGPLPDGISPFVHFDDHDGRIAFQAVPAEGADLAGLSQDGTTAVGCTFTVPEAARGKVYSVRVGLWIPARIGRPDERLIPDRGRLDRRVTIGLARITAAGEVTLEPAAAES